MQQQRNRHKSAINSEMGRAKRVAEKINRQIITTLSSRRSKVGVGVGDRPAAGAARPAVQLVELETTDQEGKRQQVTDAGAKTAIRKLPVVLARMDEKDARRVAANIYATAVEKIGSIAGASIDGSSAGGGSGVSDGGATTRVQYATTVRLVGALTADHYALVPKNKRGNRQWIPALSLIHMTCVDGRDMKDILQHYGWSGHRRDVATLMTEVDGWLCALADTFGLSTRSTPKFGTCKESV